MKHTLLLVLLVTSIQHTLTAGGIDFFDGTYKEAFATAEKEGKLVFVDAYATWCGPCKRMAKDVFTQDIVGEYFNEHFINLKLDMEKTDGIAFGKEYHVSAYPTLFFIAGDGTLVTKIRGGQQADALIEHGKKALSSYDRSGQYEEKYAAGNRDYDLIYPYVEALIQAGKPHSLVVNDYLRGQPDITPEQRDALVYLSAMEVDSKIFEEMIVRKAQILTTVDAVDWDRKLKMACLSAVDKAIEYEYPELMDQAIAIAKDNLTDGGKTFEYEARMKYAIVMHDGNLYTSNAKRYLKENKYDGAVLQRVIKDVHHELGGDAEAVDLATECVKKALKYGDPDVGEVMLYSKILAMGGKAKDAHKLVDEALHKAGDDRRKISQLEAVKKRIDDVTPVKS